MTATYEKIAATTLGTTAATVSFTSISGSYTDLVVIISAQCNRAGANDFMKAKINTDTGSNYSVTTLYGTGSAAGSSRTTSATYLEFGVVPYQTEFGVYTINLNNYANTTTNKTVLSRYNHASHQVGALVNLWRSTAAITALEFALINGSSFVSGSTFTLYGIKSE
jgi:hypothetical protein